jgi:L-threonylcarbamoyladenylate synthase
VINIKNPEIINIDKNLIDAVQKAKKLFLNGSVFIYPTDTLSGFGANPFNEEAVNKIASIKKRDEGKRFILLIDSIETLLKYAELNSEKHIDFLLSIWPNPVSVVLKLNSKTSEIFNQDTAAFRIPNHNFCRKLTYELRMPLISTSVNISNQQPLIEPSVISDAFSSEVDAIFYSDKKSFIQASTLIDLSGSNPILLREGKIKFSELLDKFKMRI